MTPHLPPELTCAICCNPLNLTVDLNTNEVGSAVHEHCYVEKLLRKIQANEEPNRHVVVCAM
jgi:hypothetical protein